MGTTYQALDYNNTPPQAQAFTPIVRPFNAVVQTAAGGGSNVLTLGTGDIIQLAILPGQGSGIVVIDWGIGFDILDTGTHALVMSLGLSLVTGTLDSGQTDISAVGFFATIITPGAAGGFVYAFGPALSSVNANVCPYSIGDGSNNGGQCVNSNGAQYNLQLQVTTAAGTVSATAAKIHGFIRYAQVSQAWSN